MRRRLDLAASLVGRPDVIFLDEPTTGLDPAKREDMWDVVRSLVTDGSTVLLTTQYLEEADALADEITVIDHGRVIAHDTPEGLKRVVGGQTLEVRPSDLSRMQEAATILGQVSSGTGGPRRSARASSRSRSPTTPRSPPRCPAWRAPGSASPSCPCTCPASTRCSSPSPGRTASEDDTTDHRRRWPDDHAHRSPAPRGRPPRRPPRSPASRSRWSGTRCRWPSAA